MGGFEPHFAAHDSGPVALPRVQVLMATYNGGPFLGAQLESIAAQRGVDVVLRVLDDGSSDETAGMLSEFSRILDLEVISPRNRLGLPDAFLSLMDGASAEAPMMALADQDDVWSPDKLRAAAAALKGLTRAMWMSDVSLIGSDGAPLDKRPTPLQPERLGFGNALVQTPRPGCSMVFTSDLLPYLQGIDPGRIVMHDSWLYISASAFGTVVSDPRKLTSYRVHESNAVGLANSPIQRSRRLLDRAIHRSSPWAIQARYLLERAGHSLNDGQRLAALAVCEPGLEGVRLRTGLWRRGELRASSASQDALLLASLLLPISSQQTTRG